MHALGAPDTAEIRAEGGIAEAGEGLGQRIGHLVGVGAAAQRVRMGDQRDALRRIRPLHDDLDLADRAIDQNLLFDKAHGSDLQAFDDFAADQVLVDDFIDIVLVDEGIPGLLRIDDHHRTVVAAPEQPAL
jgi:hypothetical protein